MSAAVRGGQEDLGTSSWGGPREAADGGVKRARMGPGGSLGGVGRDGVAASILRIPPGSLGVDMGSEENRDASSEESSQPELPQSVLQIVATSLGCDLLVAALVRMNVAETVLCVPKGRMTVPVKFNKAVLKAAGTGRVVSTERMTLPSMLSVVLGDRPQRLLATEFRLEGHLGICYALWLKPGSVPPDCEQVMDDAGQSLPLLLAAKVRTLCWDRMGRRFDVILRTMPQAVVFVDDGIGPCLINSAASELLGLDGAGEVDTNAVAAGMCRLADRCVVRASAYRCFKQVGAHRDQLFEWEWELKDPRRVYRVRSYPVSKNVTHGRIWFFDDITPERDARAAVEAADKAKTQFMAMMSHELRTPMTGVLGMLELLRLTSLSPEQASFVRIMQGSAEGLMQVLDEILDFSAIQSGQFTLEVSDFHIGELLEQLCALFQSKLAEKQLKLTVRMPERGQQAVRGDERIRQVITNLVSNAIKFTQTGGIDISWLPVAGPTGPPDESTEPDTTQKPEGKEQAKLSLTLPKRMETEKLAQAGKEAAKLQQQEQKQEQEQEQEQEHGMWHEVRVKDSGIGLSKEQQGRLFQSFSQADTSTTRKFGGTGLGLAISKGLVTAMGGRIWVESEVGKGSTFAFCIPLQPALDPSGQASGEDRPSPLKSNSLKMTSRSLRVLAAEDDKVSQLLLRRMLQHYGHSVDLVSNGQQALEAVQKGSYDMVLMDLQMPVLDGLQATKLVRALGTRVARIPIYALTADVLTKERETLEAMGLDGYLTKPINWENLSQVIDTVILSISADSAT